MGILNGSKCGAHMSSVSLTGLTRMLRHAASNKHIVDSAQVCIDFNWMHVNRTNAYDSMKHRFNKVANAIEDFSKCGCVC